MQRGRKQGLWVGRRVPEVDEKGVPILYSRYTSLEEVTQAGAKRKQAGAANGGAAGKKKGKAAAAGGSSSDDDDSSASGQEGSSEPGAASGSGSGSDSDSDSDSEEEQQQQQPKKKQKQAAAGKGGAAAAAPAAADEEDSSSSGDGDDSGGSSDEEAGGQPGGKAAGNADEAQQIRSVLGFEGAAAKPAGGFAFSFDAKVAAQVEAETDAKLARLIAIDSADKDGYVPRRVFVGGMPYSYSREQVEEYWSYCGPIESLDLLTFPDSGRFRGIAFITYATPEGYEAALACDGEQVDGQTLKTPGYNVAYVGNIAFEVTPDELREVFSGCGAKLVRLHTDQATGRSKGYAHVHFEDEGGLDRAMELDGHVLQGRGIRVSYGQPKK
ncbi:MAG: hypothetical protein J3K34DRAFT_516642 [Monoraphidium minutum]|nr:MAG: hypothetical protein J3K34DRAFT_516642 [Monoraphidium minutum]